MGEETIAEEGFFNKIFSSIGNFLKSDDTAQYIYGAVGVGALSTSGFLIYDSARTEKISELYSKQIHQLQRDLVHAQEAQEWARGLPMPLLKRVPIVAETYHLHTIPQRKSTTTQLLQQIGHVPFPIIFLISQELLLERLSSLANLRNLTGTHSEFSRESSSSFLNPPTKSPTKENIEEDNASLLDSFQQIVLWCEAVSKAVWLMRDRAPGYLVHGRQIQPNPELYNMARQTLGVVDHLLQSMRDIWHKHEKDQESLRDMRRKEKEEMKQKATATSSCVETENWFSSMAEAEESGEEAETRIRNLENRTDFSRLRKEAHRSTRGLIDETVEPAQRRTLMRRMCRDRLRFEKIEHLRKQIIYELKHPVAEILEWYRKHTQKGEKEK